jgi:hypothetical protein
MINFHISDENEWIGRINITTDSFHAAVSLIPLAKWNGHSSIRRRRRKK